MTRHLKDTEDGINEAGWKKAMSTQQQAYRFDILKNLFEHGLQPTGPAKFYELPDDAYAIGVAERILNQGESDMVRVVAVGADGETDRIIKEVYA